MKYRVNFQWDAEAAVWIATSEDIPGLVLESGSIDALIERVRYAAYDLIGLSMQKDSLLDFRFERQERLYA